MQAVMLAGLRGALCCWLISVIVFAACALADHHSVFATARISGVATAARSDGPGGRLRLDHFTEGAEINAS
jgi:hypothetical protein